jgi:hypothetical protein
MADRRPPTGPDRTGPRPPPLDESDPLLQALRALPALTLAASEDGRIAARAGACFAQTAAREQHRARRMAARAARLARPLVPLSIAGFALVYLIWAFHTAATFLPP